MRNPLAGKKLRHLGYLRKYTRVKCQVKTPPITGRRMAIVHSGTITLRRSRTECYAISVLQLEANMPDIARVRLVCKGYAIEPPCSVRLKRKYAVNLVAIAFIRG